MSSSATAVSSAAKQPEKRPNPLSFEQLAARNPYPEGDDHSFYAERIEKLRGRHAKTKNPEEQEELLKTANCMLENGEARMEAAAKQRFTSASES